MTTAEAIYTYLQSVPALTSLVADRIFPGVAPVGAGMPFINIQRIFNKQESAHDGDQTLGEARYQFSVYSPDFTEVESCREALLAINGQKVEVDGFGELLFLHADDREGFDNETREHHAMIDFNVWH